MACSIAKILRMELRQGVKSIVLQAGEAVFAQGSTAINRDDQILVGNANLVADARLIIAFLLSEQLGTILLEAFAGMMT